MIVTQFEPAIVVPVSEATVAEIVDGDAVGRQVILTNLHATNTLYWKFQYSTDRSSYTDLAAFATLAPGASVPVTLTRSETYHRLRAYGNLTMAMAVTRPKAFNGVFPLVSI